MKYELMQESIDNQMDGYEPADTEITAEWFEDGHDPVEMELIGTVITVCPYVGLSYHVEIADSRAFSLGDGWVRPVLEKIARDYPVIIPRVLAEVYPAEYRRIVDLLTARKRREIEQAWEGESR